MMVVLASDPRMVSLEEKSRLMGAPSAALTSAAISRKLRVSQGAPCGGPGGAEHSGRALAGGSTLDARAAGAAA